MPHYELLVATKVVSKTGYEAILKSVCKHIWSRDGAIQSIVPMGTRNFPHEQSVNTKFGVIKVWKGTYFKLNTHLPMDALSELETLAKEHDDVVFCKVAAPRPVLPVWCKYREDKNERTAVGLGRQKLFD